MARTQEAHETTKFTHSTIFFTGLLPSREQEKKTERKAKAPVTCRISSVSMESQKERGEDINSEEEMGINE